MHYSTLQQLIDNHVIARDCSARTPTWFWCADSTIPFNKSITKSLEDYSDANSTNCRLCFHQSTLQPSHIMLIVERRGMNIPPHYHLNKSDFIMVMHGHITYYEFTSYKCEVVPHALFPGEGIKSPSNTVHAVEISSDRATYLEVSDGPFKAGADAHYPDWAMAWHSKRFESIPSPS